MTRLFYAVMVAFMRYEQAIGRATGRNSKSMGQLAEDITRWEGNLLRMEVRHVH
jgi:hypothetical protein